MGTVPEYRYNLQKRQSVCRLITMGLKSSSYSYSKIGVVPPAGSLLLPFVQSCQLFMGEDFRWDNVSKLVGCTTTVLYIATVSYQNWTTSAVLKKESGKIM